MTQAAREATPSSTGYRSSVIALVLGIVLAVVVTRLLSAVGWTGEYASQTAGAASGAAPLLMDGFRQRRELTRRLHLSRLARLRYARPPLLVASLFGFALLVIDSLSSYILYNLTELVIWIADGDSSPARELRAYQLSFGLVQAVFVLVMTAVLARSAAYRIVRARKRWIWFGMAVYLVVRVAQLIITRASIEGTSTAVLIAAAVLVTPILGLVAMIGVWRADRTQAAYNALAYFRRLPAEDQEAALALLSTEQVPHPLPPVPRATGRSQ
jgi:hypothetical protein